MHSLAATDRKIKIHLAPMEGVVNHVFRDLLTQIGGIDRCTTEFIRVTQSELTEKTFYRYCPELKQKGCTPSGVPVFIQLLGSDPPLMAANAYKAANLGAPGIDLNFGCPAPTVNRHDGGATLLKNPSRIFHVVQAVRQAVPTPTPVTAKIRLGYSHKELHLEIAQAVEAGGAQSITVHARTRDEFYRPPAHWEYLASIRESVPIPVTANGDIWSLEDFKKCRSISGCHHFALGRPLISTPDLARQIKNDINEYNDHGHHDAKTKRDQSLRWSDIQKIWIPFFLEKNQSDYGDSFTLCRLKQWLQYLSRTYKEAQVLFNQIKVCHHLTEMRLNQC